MAQVVDGCWLVTGRLLVWVSRCPWARHLTPTTPNELVVAMHGWHRRRFVNVCMNGWMSVNIVQHRQQWESVNDVQRRICVNKVYLQSSFDLTSVYDSCVCDMFWRLFDEAEREVWFISLITSHTWNALQALVQNPEMQTQKAAEQDSKFKDLRKAPDTSSRDLQKDTGCVI